MNEKQIKIGTIISYISIGVNILVGLLYTPWMVKQIGQSQYGLYTLANSLITLFLFDFGLSSATARFISKYHAEGNQQAANNFLEVVYKLYGLIDLVLFAAFTIIFVFIDSIYTNLTPEELRQFKVVYIIAASFNLVNLPFVTLNGILTAYEKFIQLKFADLIYRVVLVGLTVIALLSGMGLYALVSVNAIAGLVVIIYKYIVIKTCTPVRVNFGYSDKSLIKEVFGFSVWAAISTLSSRLIFNITPSILGIVANSAAIAIFGVITTIEGYTYTITTAINGMFMTEISRIYLEPEDKAKENLMSLMVGVGKFQFALNGLIIIGFFLVGRQFIGLWMGEDYASAYVGILLVITPGLFFNTLQIADTAMVIQKKVNIQAYIALACGVINVILSFILSRFLGVIGACISICIAYSIRAIAYHVVCKKCLHLSVGEFIKKCYLRMLPSLCIGILFGILLNLLIKDGGWFTLILKAALIAAVYLISTLYMSLSKEERAKFFNRIKKRG